MIVRSAPLLLFLLAPVEAQRLLAPASVPPEQLAARIQTKSGLLPATVRPADLSGTETYLVLADWIPDGDSATLLRDVDRWLKSSRANAPRRLLVLSGATVGEITISRNPATTLDALRDLLSLRDSAVPSVEAGELYEAFISALPEAQPVWQVLYWYGRLPGLDPDVSGYAAARLLWTLGGRRIALRPAQAEADVPEWMAGVPALRAASGPDSPALVEVEWSLPALKRGFQLQPVELTLGSEEPLRFTAIVAPAGAALPSLRDYSRLRAAVSASQQAGAAESQLRNLESVLEINPGDPEALNAAAALATRLREPSLASKMYSALLELEPGSAALKRSYALALSACCTASEAAGALKLAVDSNPGDAILIEHLGRAELSLGRHEQAISRFRESLAIAPNNEALWWILADTAKTSAKPLIEAEALQSALRLDSSRLDRRTRLISLLIQLDRLPDARQWIDPVWGSLPKELAVVSEYARFWERLSEPAKALELWRAATGIDNSNEPAHAAVARITLASGRAAESLTASIAGLKVAPQSARLHLLHGEALLKLNRWNDARLAFRAGLQTKDLALLRASAEAEDPYGSGAAGAWLRYAALLPVTAPARKEALDRARFVALRDSDGESLSAVMDKLEEKTGAHSAKPAAHNPDSAILIPGGADALAFLARMPRTPAPEFLHAFSLAVVKATDVSDERVAKQFREEVDNYFELLHKLRARGTVKDLTVSIPLSAADRKLRDRTNDTLSLLGYRLKHSGGKTSVDAGVKSSHADRQTILSALAVDEVEMEEALESGKTFSLEYKDSVAPVLFGAPAWLREFRSMAGVPGGYVQFLALNTEAARLYAALSSCDAGAAGILYRRFGLRELADKYAGRLLNYGHSLNLEGKAAYLPGGQSAAPVWRGLAGADPANAELFIPALLTKDDGRLLAWFANLSQLSEVRQRFLTLDMQRAKAFYEVFKDAPEFKVGPDRAFRESPVLEFIKSFPIAADGSVNFPGGASVWQVAKGQSDITRVSKLLKKANRVSPAEEDEILLRLIRQRYDAVGDNFSQAENFLAVARMDAQRDVPLTPEEALILTQQYAVNAGAFPFLSALPALKAQDFAAFFRFSAAASELSDSDVNPLLTHFNSVAKIICILSENGTLSHEKAAQVFRRLCESLNPRSPRSSWTTAVAGIWSQILPEASAQSLEAILFSPQAPSSTIEAFREVLKLQKIPQLDNTLALVGLAKQVAAAHANPKSVPAIAAEIEKRAAGLPVMSLTKKTEAKKELREFLESHSISDLARILRETVRKAERRKPNPKDFEKLSTQLLERLSGPLSLASLGIVYARYLRPSDLLVSDDPWFVRKHQFVELDSSARRRTIFAPAALTGRSEGMGSYVSGSLADFAIAAGDVGAASRPPAVRVAVHAYSAQLASIRSVSIAPLSESDLRLVHARILLGRERLVASALNANASLGLAHDLNGRISRHRLRQVLDSINSGDAGAAISQFSLSDLYCLGVASARLPAGSRWSSPIWKTIESAERLSDPNRLHLLGPVIPETFGHDFPRLEQLPPYEDLRQYLMPTRLARRTAEFKLALACYADRSGLPAATLESQAETLLARAIEQVRMSDTDDWRALIAAYREVQGQWLEPAGNGSTR